MNIHRTLQSLRRPVIISLTLAILAVAASGAPLQFLSGHVPAGISQSQTNGALNSSQRLDLAIGLPLRNQAQLTNFLDQLYDPASLNWQRFLKDRKSTR